MFCVQGIPRRPNLRAAHSQNVQDILLSMEFSRQEYWSGLPFPSPGLNIYRIVQHRSVSNVLNIKQDASACGGFPETHSFIKIQKSHSTLIC